MTFQVLGIKTQWMNGVLAEGLDANGQAPIRQRASAGANPCRHCLQLIPDGEPLLVLSYRPFSSVQPYAETGPIFLHATDCTRYEAEDLPDWFEFFDAAILRGYDERDWILYETGTVVAGPEIRGSCEQILANPDVRYVHIRSKFNCFQCEIRRVPG